MTSVKENGAKTSLEDASPEAKWEALEMVGLNPVEVWRELFDAIFKGFLAFLKAGLEAYWEDGEDEEEFLQKVAMLREWRLWTQKLTDEQVKNIWMRGDELPNGVPATKISLSELEERIDMFKSLA